MTFTYRPHNTVTPSLEAWSFKLKHVSQTLAAQKRNLCTFQNMHYESMIHTITYHEDGRTPSSNVATLNFEPARSVLFSTR